MGINWEKMKKEPKIGISISLDKGIVDAIDIICKEKKVTRSLLLNYVLGEALLKVVRSK